MKISIITPTFNRQDCVERCLDSVSSQLALLPSDCSVEHIIVDDGSTDGSVSVIKSYADRHDHVRPIFFEKNRGVNAARNAAISASAGEWCLLLDSDDYLAPDALNSIISVIKANPGFRSYMFTVDDRKNDFSEVDSSVVFTFEDFLTGRIFGDFGHVVETKLMQTYPFDEWLKIYEGIFFMSFYKDAGRMLFSNILTHIRERGRADSVSWSYIRINDSIIERQLLGAKMQLDRFENDYTKIGREDIIDSLNIKVADNALLIGNYEMALDYLSRCRVSYKSVLLKIIGIFRLRRPYKRLLQTYLSVKYKRLNCD